MTIKIYEEKKEEKKEEKLDWSLRLVEDEDGYVCVVAVDSNSGCRLSNGWLLCFEEDGTVCMCEHVNPALGFERTKNGRIVTY